MINLSRVYLLMIEPDQEGPPSAEPIEDELTKKVDYLFSICKEGTGYLGWHSTQCGKKSDVCDYTIPGFAVTNSLCTYYIRHYRPYIPQSEIDKINDIYNKVINNYQPSHRCNECIYYDKTPMCSLKEEQIKVKQYCYNRDTQKFKDELIFAETCEDFKLK
jgi:hypothetical protein